MLEHMYERIQKEIDLQTSQLQSSTSETVPASTAEILQVSVCSLTMEVFL